MLLQDLKKEVLDAMMPYYTDIYGNASSKFYKIGRDAEQALYKLRESVAKSLNAKNVNEIYFTGSGCEADNWAIKGIDPNGETRYGNTVSLHGKYIAMWRKPSELKHLSRRRKRKKHRFPK